MIVGWAELGGKEVWDRIMVSGLENCSKNVLAPIDGSDGSFRALEFAIERSTKYGGGLHVHSTDYVGETSGHILGQARELLSEAGVDLHPEIARDLPMTKLQYAEEFGEDTPRIADVGESDPIVMKHRGTGRSSKADAERVAESYVRAAEQTQRFPQKIYQRRNV